MRRVLAARKTEKRPRGSSSRRCPGPGRCRKGSAGKKARPPARALPHAPAHQSGRAVPLRTGMRPPYPHESECRAHGLPQDRSRGCPRDRVVDGHPARSARLVVEAQVVVGPPTPAPAYGDHRRGPDLIDLGELEGSDGARPPEAVPDLKPWRPRRCAARNIEGATMPAAMGPKKIRLQPSRNGPLAYGSSRSGSPPIPRGARSGGPEFVLEDLLAMDVSTPDCSRRRRATGRRRRACISNSVACWPSSDWSPKPPDDVGPGGPARRVAQR